MFKHSSIRRSLGFARPSLVAALLLAPFAVAQTDHAGMQEMKGAGHDAAMMMQHHGSMPPAAAATHEMAADGREFVYFPPQLREHTLSNMRDHLLALQQIQASLAQHQFDQAAEIAEQRLGMSSMALHGAHEVGKWMPQGMREAGVGMHRHASRFSLAARDAALGADIAPALQALSEVTGQCVACHSGWRLKGSAPMQGEAAPAGAHEGKQQAAH